jgi:3-oxoacyl-[acyl-carrier-protein] synthase-3
MIYSDGAGAIILESRENDDQVGVLAHKTRTDSINHAFMLWMDKSFNPNYGSNDLFLKMNGRKLYEYALMTVPQLIKESLDKAGLSLQNIKKILIHQANAKMDEAMLSRLFKLYHEKNIPDGIMPMTINKLGNNSVATLPILYDLIKKGKLDGGQCEHGDCIVFASVGAGMNVNSLVYKVA